jgi:hypothetical protein
MSLRLVLANMERKTFIAIILMDNDWRLQKTMDKAMNLVVTST